MLALIEAWGDNDIVLGIFTDVGAYPPKPPPLVELQRNPPGLRFFCPFNIATQHRNKSGVSVR